MVKSRKVLHKNLLKITPSQVIFDKDFDLKLRTAICISYRTVPSTI